MNQTQDCQYKGPNAGFCSLCQVRDKSICAELNSQEISEISKTMAHRPVPEGKALISEGEPNGSLFVVVDGSFRLVRHLEDGRRQVVGFLFQGDYLGIQPTEASFHTAEALEPSMVCRFPHEYLDDTSRKYPGIKNRLLSRGQSEMQKAEEHIVLLGKKTAEERVLSFLEMVRAHGSSTEDTVFLSMSRQDMADYLGLRLETLSRTLAGLKKSGTLKEVSGRRVVFADAISA